MCIFQDPVSATTCKVITAITAILQEKKGMVMTRSVTTTYPLQFTIDFECKNYRFDSITQNRRCQERTMMAKSARPRWISDPLIVHCTRPT